jgi:hypothetical protein
MSAAIVATLLLTTHLGADNGAEKLWGTWRLVSFTRTVTATGATIEVFGKEPHGFITYGPDGRMMVLLVKSERTRPDDVEKMTDAQRAELFKTMIAYAGKYTFDGNAVTHHIDVSANQNWTGSHQVRYVKLEGNRLTLTTAPGPSSFDGTIGVGTLTFEKVAR